ncbi:MAG: FeoA family protein [Candidatus Cloacimonadota bacterium]|nr:FeoA family protein [Candidatus Cloacimonadota bacterium]
MFGRGKEHRGKGRKRCRNSHPRHRFRDNRFLNLCEAEVGKKYVVMNNPDHKIMEMGVFNGCVITVHKNNQGDNNIIVGVGESRFIIPKPTACRILIR